MWSQWLHNPCPFGGSGRPGQGGNQKWLPNLYHLGGATCGQSGYITHAFSEVPSAKHGEKTRSGYLTLPSRERTCAQIGCIIRAILGVPKARRKSEVAAYPWRLEGPHVAKLAK